MNTIKAKNSKQIREESRCLYSNRKYRRAKENMLIVNRLIREGIDSIFSIQN